MWHLSISLTGSIAVSGGNTRTDRTFIDVYTIENSNSKDKSQLYYSKEFEKYENEEWIYRRRLVAFLESENNSIVTCIGDKLEVIQMSSDELLQYRKVDGLAHSLSVRQIEMFISFYQSSKVIVYNVTNLNEMRSITLHGILDGEFIPDITAVSNSLYLRTYNSGTETYKALEYQEENERSLTELTNPCGSPTYVWSVAVSVRLGVAAVVSSDSATIGKELDQIVFYPLITAKRTNFLVVDVEADLYRIRISDRDGGLLTGIQVTGEVKMYHMADLFSYCHLKEKLASILSKEDCMKLCTFFALSESQKDKIVNNEKPAESLLIALEGKGVLLPNNVHNMIDAFQKLKIDSFCSEIVKIYQNTRADSTSYDRFLSTLSAHLVAHTPGNLCDSFNISGEKKDRITSSQNPGLSLLLTLHDMKVIEPSKVEDLKQPFTDLSLVQAVAKINEYNKSVNEDENVALQEEVTELTMEEKEDLFIRCLQKKIKICYETMSPVPWKNSCKWKAADLFVETTLTLTNVKIEKSRAPNTEECELHYREIFTHDRIKAETRILLEGDPGAGKTLLMYQLAYEWSQGKFKNIRFLILVPLTVLEGMNLTQAIKHFYIPDDNRLSVTDIEMFLSSERNSKCLLLDGWEEYNSKVKEGEQSEVMKIMSKLKYPTCKTILSSRFHDTKSLPKFPVLKLSKFGKVERNAYIQKAFPNNFTKQTDARSLTVDNQVIYDLCSLPLLFVMVVHNIESTRNLQLAKTDRVTPIVKSVVDALCPVSSAVSKAEESGLPVRDENEKDLSLEQLAYDGLCTEKQQFHWQREFIESKLGDSKRWIDSGILVMEEIIADIKRLGRSLTSDLLGRGAKLNDDVEAEEDENTSPVMMEAVAELQTHTGNEVKSITGLLTEVQPQNTQSSSTATSVLPLQVKFFHKIIQEWFAAKYLSVSVATRFRNSYFLQGHLKENLLLINPFDLRYVLRFAVALSPTCCHIVIKHLLKSYRSDNGDLPKHVMDYIFLCFAEYNGGRRHDMLEAVADICKEDIVINSEDTRVVQQAKVDMLQLASNCGIVIRKLFLHDVIVIATEHTLHFSSDVILGVLHTVEIMEVNDLDGKLTTELCSNVLKFIANCAWIKEARLNLPKQPPRVDDETAISLQESRKTVIWTAGSEQSQTLDTKTEEWKTERSQEFRPFIPDSSVYFGWNEQTALEVEKTISKRGGIIQIPNTGVQLDIPPGALPEEMEDCNICVRIIPSDFSDFSTDGYSSNSTVIVELLPSNLTFQQSCKLTLPHCLQLKKGAEYRASIFMSHHKEGTYPRWEKQTSMPYELTDTICRVLQLNSFCWVKCVIDDDIVETQRIQVYAAGRYMLPKQRAYEIEVGYFPDMPGGGEKLRSSKKVNVVSREIFLVQKEDKEPIQLLLEKVLPNEWKIIQDGGKPKEIPFEFIDLFKERSCSFKFVNYSEDSLTPVFIFKAVQCNKGVCLRYHTKVREDVSEGTQTT